jgi:NAD(P)-dependent dehydrogenase (short-subunit alcohol dehydrogenase family)
MKLRSTSALVTGAASGLGAATARRLASEGATVVVADLQLEPGRALADEIGGIFVRMDVTDTAQVIEAVEAAKQAAPLASLVCCAGIGWPERTIGRDGLYASAHSLGSYQRVLAINLVGTFDCVRLAASVMSQNPPDHDGQRGAIVMTASIAAEDGQVGQAAYSASKGGIVGMTLPVARDLSVVGIRVNTILPGLIDTPIYGSGPDADAFKSRLAESVLFPKRLGGAEEYASLAFELLTNSYMNAECIRLDAGVRLQPRDAGVRLQTK